MGICQMPIWLLSSIEQCQQLANTHSVLLNVLFHLVLVAVHTPSPLPTVTAKTPAKKTRVLDT
jgi:hypothetical protein